MFRFVMRTLVIPICSVDQTLPCKNRTTLILLAFRHREAEIAALGRNTQWISQQLSREIAARAPSFHHRTKRWRQPIDFKRSAAWMSALFSFTFQKSLCGMWQ
jgi:hypothetical protein